MDAAKNRLLSVREAAPEAGLSIPAFWRAVASGRLPTPVYPSPRAARWYSHELHEAIAATRAMPREQMANRRAAKLAKTAA